MPKILLTGKFDHTGECVTYGDSVTGDSLIQINDDTSIPIENLYNFIADIGETEIDINGKSRVIDPDNTIQLLQYNPTTDIIDFGQFDYIMRHKTTKQLYKIEMEDGSSVTVTEDHSLMIERDGILMKATPMEINMETDFVISVVHNE